jgi:hypothetical protein
MLERLVLNLTGILEITFHDAPVEKFIVLVHSGGRPWLVYDYE